MMMANCHATKKWMVLGLLCLLTTLSLGKHQVTGPISDRNSDFAVDVNGIITAPGLLLPNETITRLTYIDATGALKSVADLTDWIAGTTNQVVVTDDADGTITLSLPQDIHTGASPTFAGLTLSGLTASRLMASSAAKALVSADLASWVTGTANEINIADDGDGTITIGIVDPLIVAKGGWGLATLTDHSLYAGSGTSVPTALGVASHGQLPIGSTDADPVLAALTGTANEIDITNAAGSITIGIVNPLIVTKGGSGRATSTTAYGLLAAGTTATGAHQTLPAGLTTQIVVGGGVAALPAWGTDIPTAVTIGSKYIYRADGTDVPDGDVADNITITNISQVQDITATAATINTVDDGLVTQILVGGGAATAPVWGTDIPTAVTIGSAYVYRAGGTDVPPLDGGTGVSSLTDHSLIVGSDTNDVTLLGVATHGQIPIGSTDADPVLATLTGTAKRVTVANAAGSITLSGPQDLDTVDSPIFAGGTYTAVVQKCQ